MKEFRFKISTKPIPASRPRVARFGTYISEPYKSYRELLKDELINYIGKIESPLFDKEIALSIDIIYGMEISKSLSKKKRESLIGSPHIKRPDLDNLDKAILDAVSGLVIYDDSQVSRLCSYKKYSTEPYTEILIKELE